MTFAEVIMLVALFVMWRQLQAVKVVAAEVAKAAESMHELCDSLEDVDPPDPDGGEPLPVPGLVESEKVTPIRRALG